MSSPIWHFMNGIPAFGGSVVFNGLIQLGGTANSFPALKQSSTAIQVRLADDSNWGDFRSGSVSAVSSYSMGAGPTNFISGTPPTVTSAGTSPSVTASNGTVAFRVNVGTGGTATTIVLALPAATTGWNCFAENITATAANRANQRVVMQSSTTTSLTVQNQTISTGAALAFTASDIVSFICFSY